MNITYFKFLFVDTMKRKSIWITWLLYLLTVIAMLIILPIASTLTVYQLWANTTVAICQSFVGLTVAIYTSILAINIFKNSNDEGTELIIISKPISRVKIVFSKFIVFFTFALLVNLTAVAVSATTYFIPGIEKKFYWGLVLSMFIGNLVTFGVYGFIAILLSLKFQKAGIIVTNVIIAIVLFVYQILAVFVFSSSLQSVLQMEEGSIVTESYTLPVKNSKDGTYTEEHFVDFVSSLNKEQEYEMKVVDWAGVKDYWDKQNAKENKWAIIASDIGTQLSASYLTVNVNGYSDRQATRMYNFSRYYDYELTKPASPEYYDETTGEAISPLKFVYFGDTAWTEVEIEGTTYDVYGPTYYLYPGVRSTKASFLKGTMADKIPVADLEGKDALNYNDVTFEPDEWEKYGKVFDIMYDNVFRYDIKNGNGDYYYDYSSTSIDELAKSLYLNHAWCYGTENLKRYYRLVWACLSGHHGDNEYFGSNDPLKDYDIKYMDINSVFDLNYRYLQWKDYLFYKVYDEQHDLFFNGNSQWSNYEKILYQGYDYDLPVIGEGHIKGTKEYLQEYLTSNGMTCEGTGIGENGYIIRALPDGGSKFIQPGTQAPNLFLLINIGEAVNDAFKNGYSYTFTDPWGRERTIEIVKKKESVDDEWINEAVNSSYAKWIKQSTIADTALDPWENYLFDSLDTPERNNNWVSDQYTMYKNWYPYSINLYAESIETYYPFGQNLELSMYTCKNKVQFWVFAAIWGAISVAGYAAGFIAYNKYDVK